MNKICDKVIQAIGSRWTRPNYDPVKGPYNGYEVLFITNLSHLTDKHPPQVVYKGDNGKLWSLPLQEWPGSLVPEQDVDCFILVHSVFEKDGAYARVKEKLWKATVYGKNNRTMPVPTAPWPNKDKDYILREAKNFSTFTGWPIKECDGVGNHKPEPI